MSSIKKVLSIILILALALVACGGLGGCSGKKKPLRVLLDLSWASGEAESAMGEFLAEVERRGGPVDVEIETLPTVGEDEAARDAAITRLRTEIMAGGGPDVFILRGDSQSQTGDTPSQLFLFPEKIIANRQLLTLDDYIENAQFMEWEKLTPVVMEAGRGEQGQAILPMTYQLPLTYFRQADADHTPSAALTWQDMLVRCGNGKAWQAPFLGGWRMWMLFTEEELRTHIQAWIGLDRRNGAKWGLLFAACYAIMAVDSYLIFGKGRWDMGRSKKDFSDKSYVALDLNEINVQAIFDRCLAKEDSKNESRAELFYRSLGYNEEDSIPITFDSDIISRNRKSIMYLYGQLDSVHTGKYLNERQLVTDFAAAYTGKTWTNNKGILLELLYLGCNDTVVVILPFEKMKSNSTLIHPSVKPTLSPKDPAFPEWWEQHKAEWEG